LRLCPRLRLLLRHGARFSNLVGQGRRLVVPRRAGLVHACASALLASPILLLVLLTLLLVLAVRCSVLGIILALAVSYVRIRVCFRVLRLARVSIVGNSGSSGCRNNALSERRRSCSRRCRSCSSSSTSGDLCLSARHRVLVRRKHALLCARTGSHGGKARSGTGPGAGASGEGGLNGEVADTRVARAACVAQQPQNRGAREAVAVVAPV
jgi:hypothetical protein